MPGQRGSLRERGSPERYDPYSHGHQFDSSLELLDLTSGIYKLDAKLLKYLNYVKSEHKKLQGHQLGSLISNPSQKLSLNKSQNLTQGKTQILYPTDTLNF